MSPSSPTASRTFGPVSVTDFVRYAGASGDFNPLHHDDAFARRQGHAGAFAQGLLTAGYLSTFLGEWVGESSVRRLSVRFLKPVWPGEELVCKGERRRRDDGSIEVELLVENQSGEVKLRGSAVVGEGASSDDR